MSVTRSLSASWHVLVPDEDESPHGKYVWRCVPDDGVAWHVRQQCPHPVDGLHNINDRSFGVEVVNWQDGRDKFSDWQLETTAALVRYWRGLGVKYLFTHAYLDPSRRDDPTTIFDWDKFMGLVLAEVKPEPYAPGPVKIVDQRTAAAKLIECSAELRDDGKVWVDNAAWIAGMGLGTGFGKMVPLRDAATAFGLGLADHIPDQRKVYITGGAS